MEQLNLFESACDDRIDSEFDVVVKGIFKLSGLSDCLEGAELYAGTRYNIYANDVTISFYAAHKNHIDKWGITIADGKVQVSYNVGYPNNRDVETEVTVYDHVAASLENNAEAEKELCRVYNNGKFKIVADAAKARVRRKWFMNW